jgi:hypothetical protein
MVQQARQAEPEYLPREAGAQTVWLQELWSSPRAELPPQAEAQREPLA